MSDTPRTDAELIRMINDQCEGFFVSPDFARELERELNAANERIQNLEAAKIHSCHSGCQRPECVLRRRVKELEKANAGLRFALRELVEQCKTGDDITAWWRTAVQRAEEALAEDDQPSQQKEEAQ